MEHGRREEFFLKVFGFLREVGFGLGLGWGWVGVGLVWVGLGWVGLGINQYCPVRPGRVFSCYHCIIILDLEKRTSFGLRLRWVSWWGHWRRGGFDFELIACLLAPITGRVGFGFGFGVGKWAGWKVGERLGRK